MKTLRNTFALLILSIAFYSCDADATLNELDQADQTEFDVTIVGETGDQGNEGDERPEETTED